MTEETVPPGDGWAKLLAQATATFLAVLAGGALSYLGASTVPSNVSGRQASNVSSATSYWVGRDLTIPVVIV
jgi:hypothetical protein